MGWRWKCFGGVWGEVRWGISVGLLGVELGQKLWGVMGGGWGV